GSPQLVQLIRLAFFKAWCDRLRRDFIGEVFFLGTAIGILLYFLTLRLSRLLQTFQNGERRTRWFPRFLFRFAVGKLAAESAAGKLSVGFRTTYGHERKAQLKLLL